MPEPEQAGEIINVYLAESVEESSERIAGREATPEQTVAVAQRAAVLHKWSVQAATAGQW